LEVRVDEETLKNVVQHSVTTALASMVFPVPGGPTISTPLHGRRKPWTQSIIFIFLANIILLQKTVQGKPKLTTTALLYLLQLNKQII
jgi:uncharacterized membrane protein YobD (UPF0266 family)